MDPIDEIDGKKQRRTMLENMQRSSSLFQSKIQKAEKKSAAEVKQNELPPAQSNDSLDFSSEFTSQDADHSSNTGEPDITSWDDLLEDDDWQDDEEEGQDAPDEQAQHPPPADREHLDEVDDEEASPEIKPPPGWSPPIQKGRYTSGQAHSVEDSEAAPKAEERLGFEWGVVDSAKRPSPATSSQEPALQESGEPSFSSVPDSVPEGVTRRSGWESRPTGSPVISPRIRPLGAVMLPPRGQLQAVDSSVASAAALLIQTPADEPGYEECIRLLGRFGLGALRLCCKAKVQVHILDEKGFATFDKLAAMGLSPDDFPADGAYLPKSKTCLVDRRCLTDKPMFFHPVLYYFAHALDHAQGGDDFSSRKAAAVVACFDASQRGINGNDFVDELAAADPVRYFARSVSIYLQRDDCEQPLWTHQDLRDFDRSMFDYLEYLFGRWSVQSA